MYGVAEIPCLRDFRAEAYGHGKSEDALFCTLVGAERRYRRGSGLAGRRGAP